MSDKVYKNTDKELWREPQADGTVDYYSNSIHLTDRGGVGINVGGSVHVKTLEQWHALAQNNIKGNQMKQSTDDIRESFDPFDFVESCLPDCDDVRHARHAGQWDMATRIEQALDTANKGKKHKGANCGIGIHDYCKDKSCECLCHEINRHFPKPTSKPSLIEPLEDKICYQHEPVNKINEIIDKRLDDILAQLETDFYSYFSGNWDSSTPNDPQLEAHNKLTKLINLLLAEVIDEVVGADIELRGDIDDKLLAFVPDMHQRSLEVTGVSSGFTNLYTRALVNQVLAQVRKQAKDMLGEK